MAPTKQTKPEGWFQEEILTKLSEVKTAVDESLRIGREAGESIRSLRKELGVDTQHGRLPELEKAVSRFDRRQEEDHKELLRLMDEQAKKQHADKNRLLELAAIDKVELCKRIDESCKRIDALEKMSERLTGGSWLLSRAVDILTSSLAAGVIIAVARALGWIH